MYSDNKPPPTPRPSHTEVQEGGSQRDAREDRHPAQGAPTFLNTHLLEHLGRLRPWHIHPTWSGVVGRVCCIRYYTCIGGNTASTSTCAYWILYGTVRLPPLLARSTGPCLAPSHRLCGSLCARAGWDHSAEKVCATEALRGTFAISHQRRPRERLPFDFLPALFAPRCSSGGRDLCGEAACSHASGERLSSNGSRLASAASKLSATM